MKKQFAPNHWGSLDQFQIPYSIIQNDRLALSANALAVLLVLFETGKTQQGRNRRRDDPYAEAMITQKLISERTGYAEDSIRKAVKELVAKRFIRVEETRKKHSQFGSNNYVLCNPETGNPLPVKGGRNFLLSSAIRYIPVPTCIVREHEAEWSIARMNGSELRMYMVICWLANNNWFKNKGTKAEIDITLKELNKLGGFSALKIAQSAVDSLIYEKSLISFNGEELVVFDPQTGEHVHEETGDPQSDPANYYVKGNTGNETRWNSNRVDGETLDRYLRACGASPVPQGNGNLKINCPFHDDSTPSCSVSPHWTCFNCFGCTATGTLTQLLMKLSGRDEGTVRQLMAEWSGQPIEFHDPDSSVEAIYSYRHANTKLVKQVVRHPGKKFIQRRPGKGGWVYNIDGVPPMLYNLDRFKLADVVIVCEGEKDCETITDLKLYPARGGDVVATTSGNSESWADQLADHLKGKRVVLMPDADEAGEKYRAAVEASLKSRSIEYRVVSFKDAGAKDVSDFVANGGSKGDLVQRIGRDWVQETEYSRFYDNDGSVTI